MDVKVSAQRLCLLLSWQETLSRTPHHEAFAGRVYRIRANKAVSALRDEARAAIQEAGAQLQQRVAGGGAGAEIDQLRHRIQQLNHLLKAENAADLGGPVAMTLERYADAFGARSQGPFSFTPLERQDFITMVAALFLMTAICLGLAWFQLWRDNTAFSLARAGDRHLALTVRNGGQNPITFVGSWPSVLADLETTTYGVSLYCQARGSDEFQLASSIGEVWSYQNEVLAPQRRVSVEPGVTITVVLDLQELERLYGTPLNAVRVACGTPGNRNQAVFTEQLVP